MTKDIQLELPKAEVRIISLFNGKLLIAQKISGTIKQGDILTALKKIGIQVGLLQDSIELLQRENILEMPIACAFYQDEPPKFKAHFGHEFSDDDYLKIIQGEEIPLIKSHFDVLANQKLIDIHKSFRKVLCYPDGHIEEKGVLDHLYDLRVFNGANVRIANGQMVSQIKGNAFISKWGKVYVFPILTVRGLGEIHGKLNDQYGVHVLEDIHTNSKLELPSSAFVSGMIHSSFIKVKGYVQALEGIDNSKKIENSRIIAGKTVIAPHIKRYRIMAGEDVLANEIITQSIIVSHRNVVARVVDESEIRVRNKLIADEIRAGSQIYLGPSFIKQESNHRLQITNQKTENQLKRKEFAIEETKDKIEREKKVLINYFYRLKESGQKNILMDKTMMRLYGQLQETFTTLKEHVKEYDALLQEYLTSKALLAYYARENQIKEDPQIRVYGKMAKGVLISTPNRNIKLTKSLENVTIRLDHATGALHIKTANDEKNVAVAI